MVFWLTIHLNKGIDREKVIPDLPGVSISKSIATFDSTKALKTNSHVEELPANRYAIAPF
jgi:hypothetical protein